MLVVHPPVRASEHVSLLTESARLSVPARRPWRWGFAIPLAAVAVLAAGPTLASIPLLYLAIVTPELVRVDLREHRLPNPLTLSGIAVGIVVCATESIVGGRVALVPLAAGVCYAGLLLALCLLGGMGMGDVKLGAALGFAAWLPFVGVGSVVLAFFFGGIASVVLLVRRGRGRRMAFGPSLLAGFWAAAVLVAWSRFG